MTIKTAIMKVVIMLQRIVIAIVEAVIMIMGRG